MIVLGVTYAPAPIISAMALLIEGFGLMPAQTMVMLRIADLTTAIIASLHVTGFVHALALVAA